MLSTVVTLSTAGARFQRWFTVVYHATVGPPSTVEKSYQRASAGPSQAKRVGDLVHATCLPPYRERSARRYGRLDSATSHGMTSGKNSNTNSTKINLLEREAADTQPCHAAVITAVLTLICPIRQISPIRFVPLASCRQRPKQNRDRPSESRRRRDLGLSLSCATQ